MAELAPSPVWQARTGSTATELMTQASTSVEEDTALIPVDLAGSIAHVHGLQAAGLLDPKEALTLIDGLQTLWQQHQAEELEFDPALEDVHMNIEHLLGQLVGPVAGKLHTGRSRNDQVALDLHLHTRLGLVEIASGSLDLATTLLDLAEEHTSTPWVAPTHGQPAQPATLGFLLHAHALRFLGLTDEALTLFTTHDESPLGSGAVAGSTLPIDPEVTAELLGLAPPSNALLATSDRSLSLATCQLAQRAGLWAASVAQELFLLHQQGAISLPDGTTTGSSLMPHKDNPDSLELVRATGKALAAPAHELASILAGLPLGYHRDLQAAKPPLIEVLEETPPLLALLDQVVAGLEVDTTVLAASLGTPGIGATDAAEALVAQGTAFREAYTAVAKAHAEDAPLEASLAEQGFPQAAVEAAVEAADAAGPDARTTLGGPAPSVLEPAIQAACAQAQALATSLEAAADQASVPLDLLEAPPQSLIHEPVEAV